MAIGIPSKNDHLIFEFGPPDQAIMALANDLVTLAGKVAPKK